jgi:hypothetical protein
MVQELTVVVDDTVRVVKASSGCSVVVDVCVLVLTTVTVDAGSMDVEVVCARLVWVIVCTSRWISSQYTKYGYIGIWTTGRPPCNWT